MSDLSFFINEIKAEAEHLGFSLVGVTTPEAPEHFPFFQSWIDAGNHAGMSYLSNPVNVRRRSQPALIMPECRSILVLGLPYPNPIPTLQEAQPPGTGKVAAYAWQENYHGWILAQGDELIKKLKDLFGPSVKARIFTDSAPILERELAARAGLGWIAKNSCLISPTIGSFFLLAEVFTDIPAALTRQNIPDYCGSCRRCLEACPTHCILPDRSIDSRRCISNLTIENKGIIPRNLRSSIGDWVFGCDICQIVCPWNKKQVLHGNYKLPSFSRPPLQPHLKDEMLLSNDEFTVKYQQSPILRPGHSGYLRNVAVALGNRPGEDSTDVLAHVLEIEQDALIRLHVAWALGRMKNARSKAALERRLKIEPGPDVQEEIRLSLEET
ncbi:MAG TPA: tRNA epoxyqueuosine(34) reductase QueG [Longilinea sp.]|nr:tRNA epoxyqueuosine(34) reductase QueG [Longilinea sp.]